MHNNKLDIGHIIGILIFEGEIFAYFDFQTNIYFLGGIEVLDRKFALKNTYLSPFLLLL